MEKGTPAQTLILCHLVEQEDQHRLVPSALINPYCRCIIDGPVKFSICVVYEVNRTLDQCRTLVLV